MKNLIIIFSVIFLFITDLIASDKETVSIEKGITLEIGILSTSLIDEYISSNTYSGSYPYASLGWIHNWGNGFIDISILVGNTDEMNSGDFSAWYEHETFRLDLFYKINNKLFDPTKFKIYIGPFFDHSWYYFSNTFASQTRFESEGRNLSIGLNSLIKYNYSSKFGLSLNTYSSLISIVEKSFDYQRYSSEDSNSKMASVFSSGLFGAELEAEYNVTKRLLLQAKYGLIINWINEWDKYKSASDKFSLGISYVF